MKKNIYIAPVTELVSSTVQAGLLAGSPSEIVSGRNSQVSSTNGWGVEGVIEVDDGDFTPTNGASSSGGGSRAKAWSGDYTDWDDEW